ncbi:MAG: 16S rRNA (guanine(527)-N(7))-methyltransferase RsmG [Parvularculaceae bacterium]
MSAGETFRSLEDVARRFDVSRETLARLRAFDALFVDRAQRMNLVAPATMPDRWTRHYADSAQLAEHVPADARTLLDFGSGAGFPGLVLAALLAPRAVSVTLVESVGKKAAFLTAAAQAMDLPGIRVVNDRVENLSEPPPDIVTARAVAPLKRLLGYVEALAGPRTLFVLPRDKMLRSN